MAKFNLDQILDEMAVEIEIKGKTFKVKDLPDDLAKKVEGAEEEDSLRNMVKKCLGCEDEDIAHLGIAGLSKIMDLLYENLLPGRNSTAAK